MPIIFQNRDRLLFKKFELIFEKWLGLTFIPAWLKINFLKFNQLDLAFFKAGFFKSLAKLLSRKFWIDQGLMKSPISKGGDFWSIALFKKRGRPDLCRRYMH